MPEMPEISGLVDFLAEHATGRQIARLDVAAIAALKTFDPPATAAVGLSVTSVGRWGKFIDIVLDDRLHFVTHLAKAGWLRWYDTMPATVIRPGRSPIALRVALGDGSGFDLTEAGTKKSLAVWVVASPHDVPGIARLGADALSPSLDRAAFGEILTGRRTQIKGVLRDQSLIAGIGNAYSDEILHVARLSPYAVAAQLDPTEVDTLFAAMKHTLVDACAASTGRPPAELKDSKRRAMRVHGRRGESCPVCGDVVRSVFFADRSLEYCATCQTEGKILADRRLSRLVK